MSTYKIISFDGGGVLGVVSARLLHRLNKEVSGLLDGVQLYAGTSVGSLISVSLALGIAPEWVERIFTSGLIKMFFLPYTEHGIEEMQENLEAALKLDSAFVDPLLFRENARVAFKKSIEAASVTYAGEPDQVMLLSEPNATTPMYLNPFTDLYKLFGGLIHWDHMKTDIFLGAVDLRNKVTGRWEPAFFSNLLPCSTKSKTVTEALLCSTAAPLFFSSFEGHIDGWPIVNNPSLAALGTVLSEKSLPLSDIRVLSFGVGVTPTGLSGKTLKWGKEQWFDGPFHTTMVCPPLLGLICSQNAALSSTQCQQILTDERFLRLNVNLDAAVRMDNFYQIASLVQQVDAVNLAPYIAWIEQNWV